MKSISRWAARKPTFARLLVIIFHIGLIGCAGYLGIYTAEQNIHIPSKWSTIAVSFFIITWLAAPIRHAKHSFWRRQYIRERFCISIMTILQIYFSIALGNQAMHAALAPDISKFAKFTALNGHNPDNFSYNPTEREKPLQEFKNFLSLITHSSFDYKNTGISNSTNRVRLILLIVFTMILLFIGLTFVACGIGCVANNNIVFIIALLGAAVIPILVGIKWFRRASSKLPPATRPIPKG